MALIPVLKIGEMTLCDLHTGAVDQSALTKDNFGKVKTTP